MAWAKIRFYYRNILGQVGQVLTATSTAAGFSVNNLYNMKEVDSWKANDTTDPCYVTVDTNACALTVADYVAFIGHNLGTINAAVTLQWSTDASSWTDLFTAVALRNDKAFLREFTNPGSKRYWRLKITGHSAAPQISILAFGLKTELDYASSSFDPHAEDVEANINLTQGGCVAGVHTLYSERSMDLAFSDVSLSIGTQYFADGTYEAGDTTTITAIGSDTVSLWDKLRAWWDTSGLKNFFVRWEANNAPDDIYLMRPDVKFYNPLTNGGAYRDLTLHLKGRKE